MMTGSSVCRPATEKPSTRGEWSGILIRPSDSVIGIRISPVLLYALGTLFAIPCPSPRVARSRKVVFPSCSVRAGAAQKGFALLSYWRTNGFAFDEGILRQTITRLVLRHEAGGINSDVVWSLAFCIENNLKLPSSAAKALSTAEDDCIALQALHMSCIGLLSDGFSTSALSRLIKSADLDQDHWLLTHDSLRQKFLTDLQPMVAANHYSAIC